MSAAPIRFGILGAARIAPVALVQPARAVGGVTLAAVAARDPQRAQTFARAHGVERVLDTYEALVNDPALDAIYNPLPNALHYEWTVKALRAGKHVLCEKPLASNTRQAEEMARAADDAGRVLMEAFHFRYHPLMRRVEEIVASGEIGAVRELDADFFAPLFMRPRDIRFQYALAGGALMDTGCYCIHFLRAVAGEPEVVWARARKFSAQVDRMMHAELRFPNGVVGKMGCSLAGFPPVKLLARVRGERGELAISNPFVPHYFHELRVKTPDGTRREHLTREPSYSFQLRAFLAAIRGEHTNLTDGWNGVRNMQVIDAIYVKAGMQPRE